MQTPVLFQTHRLILKAFFMVNFPMTVDKIILLNATLKLQTKILKILLNA